MWAINEAKCLRFTVIHFKEAMSILQIPMSIRIYKKKDYECEGTLELCFKVEHLGLGGKQNAKQNQATTTTK